jgi:hypothetical protein
VRDQVFRDVPEGSPERSPRLWTILFDADRTHPWVARSERGAECFFVTPEALVQFLADGGLSRQEINEVIFCLKTGAPTCVELEDSWSH